MGSSEEIASRIDAVFEAFIRNERIRTPTTESTGFDSTAHPPLEELAVAEIRRLRTDLIAVGHTFEHLASRYQVDLEYLALILIDYRIRWVFNNVWRFFEMYRLPELEKHAESLDKVSKILRDGRPVLIQEWGRSLERYMRTMRDPSEKLRALASRGATDEERLVSLLALGEALRYAAAQKSAGEKIERPLPQEMIQTFISEAVEQQEVVALAPLAEIGMQGSERERWVDFGVLIDLAIDILSKAAWTFRRRDWALAEDPQGRPIFRRGRRRTFVMEAECAEVMTTFLRNATGKALYDHAGNLLKAVYPETCGKWGDRGKPLRERVRQLLEGGDQKRTPNARKRTIKVRSAKPSKSPN